MITHFGSLDELTTAIENAGSTVDGCILLANELASDGVTLNWIQRLLEIDIENSQEKEFDTRINDCKKVDDADITMYVNVHKEDSNRYKAGVTLLGKAAGSAKLCVVQKSPSYHHNW